MCLVQGNNKAAAAGFFWQINLDIIPKLPEILHPEKGIQQQQSCLPIFGCISFRDQKNISFGVA